MAVWKHACKTMRGMELDLKLLGRGGSLMLTKARAGSGHISPTQLLTLTDVLEPVQELGLKAAVECLDEQTVRLPVVLKNTDVEESYDMRQLGVYAEDPDQGEILYLVLQAEGAEAVPSAAEAKDFTLEWYLNLSVGNAEHVEIAIRETCTLTVEEGDVRYVRKEAGKGLSANDFTDEEKGKLAGVAPGAQVNVQADWNVADETSDAFIKNKPVIPTVPTALKNPHALTFTGGVTGAYDGSVAKTVKIPSIAADIGAAPCSTVENGDFNSMTTPGIYTMRGSNTKNKPTTGNYHGLIVLKSDSGTYVQQIATKEGTTEVYVRYGSSSWGSWVRLLRDGDTVASAANATNAVNATKATQDGSGNNIADTYAKKEQVLPVAESYFTDFNNMLNPGCYRTSGAGNAPEGKTGKYFSMIVLECYWGSGGAYLHQIAFEYPDLNIYLRTVHDYSTINYGAWKKVFLTNT